MTHLPPCERQPLWEGSERSKLLILSPPNGFLSRSLFHNSSLSFGNEPALLVPTILAVKSHSLAFCAASWECAASHRPPQGDGEGGKRGTGGENPEGEGGLQPGCPPFPGLSPQDIGKPLLRIPSTQKKLDNLQRKRSQKANRKQANDHKKKSRRRHAPAGFIMWLPADCRTCPGTDAPPW